MSAVRGTSNTNARGSSEDRRRWRNGIKPDTDAVTDLRKAVWYLNDEIERLIREQEQP